MKRAVFRAKVHLLMRQDLRAFQDMRRHEAMSETELSRLIDESSVRIALHAFDNSPFYRELYSEAGFSRADIAVADNFTRLPVVTKERLRAAGDTILAQNIAPHRALLSQTGGSTGSPLRVRNDAAAPTAPMWWRIYRWWGIDPADDTAFVYRRLRQGKDAWLYAAQWWPSRHLLLDARAITEPSVEEFIEQWIRVKPRLLVAYVEGATAVAAHLERTGRKLSTSAVSVTAAMLQSGQRELLERAFGAPVFDTYRSAEIPWIAAECAAHDGLHVAADQRRIDIIDADGNPVDAGVDGSIVATDFSNEVFPLVRYEMGDRSRMLPGRCACGRAFPRIAPVQGRIADAICTPSGKRVTGGLSGLFLSSPGAIRQMQIVQHADFSITLRYVAAAPDLADEAVMLAVRTLEDLLDGEVRVTPLAVDAIESTAGKARLVVSEVEG
ncbi:phenylacetate--CoA ligase family protein [Microbacterium sp. A84]|uniref:phenylacetate--CoA ligase family protein n=1 Tax=Microbacterium sp. A84 TaxID=3450715 RepID=UPI003F43EE8C